MARETKIAAETRNETGKGVARRLRAAGALPAVLYGSGKEARWLQIDEHSFEQILLHHTGESLIVDLTIDGGDPLKVLLKEVQHHPLTGSPLHADFVEVSMTEKFTVSVPVVLVGEAPGIELGGVLDQLVRDVEIECLPTDLVEEIEVDVSGLNIGDSLQVGDIVVGPELTIVTAPDIAVATVVPPRVEEEEAEEEGEAAEEGAEPEVIGDAGKAGEEEGTKKDEEAEK